MGLRKTIRLRNSPTVPAQEAALVRALLAFSAGTRVRIENQGIEDQTLTRWSRQSEEPPEEDRSLFADILNAIIQGEKDSAEGWPPETLIPMVSNPWAPEQRHGWISSGYINIRRGQVRILEPHRAGEMEQALIPFGRAIGSPGWLCSFEPFIAALRREARFEPLVIFRNDSYQLIHYTMYSTVRAAMTVAALMVLDSTQPFRAALSRCKLPTCGRFYLARKNPAGGPANRTYCSPAHRNEHHNSAARQQANRQAETSK